MVDVQALPNAQMVVLHPTTEVVVPASVLTVLRVIVTGMVIVKAAVMMASMVQVAQGYVRYFYSHISWRM